MTFGRLQCKVRIRLIFLATILLLLNRLASAQVLLTGLAASYSFDEGAGSTTADSSGNGNAGVIQGASWTNGGRHGPALAFDGASSRVDLGRPASLQFNGSMTLTAWVYATAHPSDDAQIIARSLDAFGWQLKTSPDTGVRTFGFAISESGSSTLTQRYSSTPVELNTWYHVAGCKWSVGQWRTFGSCAGGAGCSAGERCCRDAIRRILLQRHHR
jgi:concanavalin A-like lectin/glucanase superfamily protein